MAERTIIYCQFSDFSLVSRILYCIDFILRVCVYNERRSPNLTTTTSTEMGIVEETIRHD